MIIGEEVAEGFEHALAGGVGRGALAVRIVDAGGGQLGEGDDGALGRETVLLPARAGADGLDDFVKIFFGLFLRAVTHVADGEVGAPGFERPAIPGDRLSPDFHGSGVRHQKLQKC